MNTELYDDWALAQKYLNDPSLSQEDRAALISVMGNMSKQIDSHQRVGLRSGHHGRPADPETQLRANIEARAATPRAPTEGQSFNNDEIDREAVNDLYTQHPEWFPEEPSTMEKAWGVTKALPGIAMQAAPEIAQYSTPILGNMKGAEDFGNSFDEYLNARDVDPIGALAYTPKLALDGMQALMPMPVKSMVTEPLERIAKYLSTVR